MEHCFSVNLRLRNRIYPTLIISFDQLNENIGSSAIFVPKYPDLQKLYYK